jgi:hypothetical protein
MATHSVRTEVRSFSYAFAAEYVCVGSADRVLCRLFAGILVPFVGHGAIGADMHIPSGGKIVVRLVPARAPQAQHRMARQIAYLLDLYHIP